MKRAACAVLAAVVSSCNPQAPRTAMRPPARHAHGPWLRITQSGTARQPLHIWQQIGNRKQYDLIARSYESSGAQGSTIGTFFDARVTFVARDGRRLFANAPQAIIDQASNTLTLAGGVHARTDAGMTLTSRTLRYDPKTEMLHGEGDVVIENARGVRATGDSVDADVSLSRVILR